MKEITAPPTERLFQGEKIRATLRLDGNPRVNLAIFGSGPAGGGTANPLIIVVNVASLDALTRDLLSLNDQIQEIVRAHKREDGGTERPVSP